MKEIEFDKEYYNEEKNTKFEFYYSGLVSEGYVVSEKLEELLNRFTSSSNHSDIAKNISYLRTVLKKFDENVLLIRFSNQEYTEEVLYKQSNLFFYSKKGKGQNKYEFEYEVSTGIKIGCPTNENQSLNSIDFESYAKEIQSAGETLKKLNEIKEMELTPNTKLLAEIYSLFYGENPDFSSDNINLRFQNMLSILCNFDISTAKNYDFVENYNDTDIPGSLQLEEEIESLYPLGVVNVDKPKLTPYAQKVINTVGSTIKESVGNPADLDKVMVILSRIMFVSGYNINSNIDVEKLVEDSGRSENEIKSCIKLVKVINAKIDAK